MGLKIVKLSWGRILQLGENPECRGCGFILWVDENVYHIKGHHNPGSYFCLDCIENKEVLVYPINVRGGRTKAPINFSLILT